MKDRLYDFLDKRITLAKFLMIAGYTCVLLTPTTNKPILAAALVFMLVPTSALFFLIFESTRRSHKKALQHWLDQRNSASPHWDGLMRSNEDLEPRLKLLRDRIAQDQAEFNRIVARSQTNE
jgi:hypothetical protein